MSTNIELKSFSREDGVLTLNTTTGETIFIEEASIVPSLRLNRDIKSLDHIVSVENYYKFDELFKKALPSILRENEKKDDRVCYYVLDQSWDDDPEADAYFECDRCRIEFELDDVIVYGERFYFCPYCGREIVRYLDKNGIEWDEAVHASDDQPSEEY